MNTDKIFLSLLLASFSASAATTFTEFYVQPTGSNLNAGSTTNNAAIVTYASGSWVAATGVFTLASGDPGADGVNIGDWASVYPDAAILAVFVGKITATNATTITVSLTQKSGTAPVDGTANTTLKVGGAWAGPNAAVSFPFNFAQATMTNLNSGVAQGFVPRVNITGSYTVTTGITHGNAGPIRFQGFTATPGDLGKATFDGATAGAGITMLTISAANNDFVDLIVSNSGATTGSTTDGFSISAGGAETSLVRCVAHDVRRNGFLVSGIANLVECEAYLANRGSALTSAGFNLAVAGANAIRCISHDNTGANTSGFIVNGAALFFCVSDSNGVNGATLSAITLVTVLGCDFYNNGAAGIDFTGASAASVLIQNCNFVKNTTWGVTSSGSPIRNGNIFNCGLGSGTQVNGSGGFNTAALGGINETGTITYAANVTPWVDPANGDFRINLTASRGTGRGTFTSTQSGYSTNTIAFPDVGAAQTLGGSGGSYLFVQ